MQETPGGSIEIPCKYEIYWLKKHKKSCIFVKTCTFSLNCCHTYAHGLICGEAYLWIDFCVSDKGACLRGRGLCAEFYGSPLPSSVELHQRNTKFKLERSFKSLLFTSACACATKMVCTHAQLPFRYSLYNRAILPTFVIHWRRQEIATSRAWN